MRSKILSGSEVIADLLAGKRQKMKRVFHVSFFGIPKIEGPPNRLKLSRKMRLVILITESLCEVKNIERFGS